MQFRFQPGAHLAKWKQEKIQMVQLHLPGKIIFYLIHYWLMDRSTCAEIPAATAASSYWHWQRSRQMWRNKADFKPWNIFSRGGNSASVYCCLSWSCLAPLWCCSHDSRIQQTMRTRACWDQMHLVLSLSRNAWIDGRTDGHTCAHAGLWCEHRYVEMFPGFGELERPRTEVCFSTHLAVFLSILFG